MEKDIGELIFEYVDARIEDAIALLEKTVNIESPTENLSGVKQVGMVLKDEFELLGFSTRWVEMPFEMKRAGHLLAQKNGTKGKRILLLGHLDTVLKGEKFRREGEKAYGTGIYDMKAGVSILCYALKSLHAVGALADANVLVLLTGDEENSGTPAKISRGDLTAAAKSSDLALGFEFGTSDLAIIARRGISKWQLEVTAHGGHSSQIFSENAGSGAIIEAARIINQFYETLSAEKYLTFNPALMAGGTEIEIRDGEAMVSGKANVIPAKAFARGDLRFISQEQEKAARIKMSEIVAANLNRTSAKIDFTDGIPAMPPTEANHELLRHFDEISRKYNFGKVAAFEPGERGAGDISYVAGLIPGLDGLGAAGGNAHMRGEFIDLTTLPIQIKRVALLIYRLTR